MYSEKWLEKNLRERVKAFGGMALKFWCFSFTGFPDRMILMPGGRIYFAEIKSEGKPLKPRQKIVIPWLRRLGFQVWLIDSELVLLAFFKDLRI
jgi:hypothetical protein